MPARMIAALVAALALPACGGGGGGSVTTGASEPGPVVTHPPTTEPDPDFSTEANRLLRTARFTTHQPDVLEQIGAHHAYARGLTGKGIRIGIDDTIVDYTQAGEFGSRVKLDDADGAALSYRRPFGDDPFGDILPCIRFGTCEWWRANSEGDDGARNEWVQELVRRRGWPERDDSLFVLDEYFSANDPLERLYRWTEVPTPYGRPGNHGTIVASVTAGRNLGVAPGAIIIPTAQNFEDSTEAAERILQRWIQRLPAVSRRQLDLEFAAIERENDRLFDITNHSWGYRDTRSAIVQTVDDVLWYEAYLPNTLNAILQIGTPDAEKTVRVWAAGNIPRNARPDAQYDFPSLGALLPYGIPQIRGHWIAVAATDPRTRALAGYSHRCGPLPPDWNAALHGPHYCLAAPGTVRGLVPNPNRPGYGDVQDGEIGTSFAAPIVSGSIALLMEHFRGTRGNTQIVRRMLDTADRSGRYANAAIYGAGHLDLEAALNPVGMVNVGQSGHALSATTYSAPMAYGAVGQRVGSLELASFDEQDFPFWIPVSGLIAAGGNHRSPIPRFEDEPAPAFGMDRLGLNWSTLPDAGLTLGFSETSASVARQPDSNGWGYGFAYEGKGHMDAATSGAFGSETRSGMLWTARAFRHDLGGPWSMSGTGTLAVDVPQYEGGAIFQAGTALMTAAAVRIGAKGFGVTVEQPLRAESGTGTFRLENGRIENGRRLYDTYRVPLRPESREIRLTIRQEARAMGGRVALEAGGAMNAGHVAGEREASIGLAWRTRW